jgi:hypothetical protein
MRLAKPSIDLLRILHERRGQPGWRRLTEIAEAITNLLLLETLVLAGSVLKMLTSIVSVQRSVHSIAF